MLHNSNEHIASKKICFFSKLLIVLFHQYLFSSHGILLMKAFIKSGENVMLRIFFCILSASCSEIPFFIKPFIMMDLFFWKTEL